MKIEMSGETKQAILKDFFDSIEDGLYDELRSQVCSEKDFTVKIGGVDASTVFLDGDVYDEGGHLGSMFIKTGQFMAHVHATPKSEIYVVREEKPLSLETLDKRVKKLEQTK